MRTRFLLIAATTVLSTVSCGGTERSASPEGPGPTARLEVYVHWSDTPLAGKRVEVLELAAGATTNDEGLAVFDVPAGSYTLRAYEINQGGPAYHHVDFDAKTRAGETTRIDVVDCLPCVRVADPSR